MGTLIMGPFSINTQVMSMGRKINGSLQKQNWSFPYGDINNGTD